MSAFLLSQIVDSINKHIMESTREFPGGPVPHIYCEDGTEISVQAGRYMHSLPREDEGPWTHVEVCINNPLFLQVGDDNISHYTPIEDLAHEILMRSRKRVTFITTKESL